MLLIVDTTNDFIFNFFKCFTFLIDKYNLLDAYFIHLKQRIFVGQLGSDFFNNRENWLGLQQRYVIFNFVNNINFNDHMFYDYTSSYFISRDIVFLPFNWYTRRFVYWDSTALIRGRNGYFNIFSVDSTVLGYVNERSNIAFSGGSALVMADSSGNLLTPKIFADGKVLELNNASVIYPIVTAGFNCLFVNDEGGKIIVSYGSNTSFNFGVNSSSTFNSRINNVINLGASIRRDPSINYQLDRRNISSQNLDFIQAIQPAIIGVTIVAQPLSNIPPPIVIQLPTNSEFVPSPSYQNLPFYSNISFNTYNYENNSYVLSQFRTTNEEKAIAKSISSDNYVHTSSLTLYDNSLYYLKGLNRVESIQKTNGIPVKDNLFKLYRYKSSDVETLKFVQGYIDEEGTRVSTSKYINANVTVSYSSTRIAIFDKFLLEDYEGSFSYYDNSNKIIVKDDYSSLPEILYFITAAKIIFTIRRKSFTDVNLEMFNNDNTKIGVFSCKIDPTNQIASRRRCCLSSPIFNTEITNAYLKTDLPTDLFTVYFLTGRNNIIESSKEVKDVETLINFVGTSYSFVVFSKSPSSLSIENLINNVDQYGKIIRLADLNDKEGKMITIVDFPSSDDVRGAVEDSLFSYSIEESGAYNNKQSYVVSTYPKNSSILSIKDETLLVNQYNELLNISRKSPYPFKIIIADNGITKGIRMMKEAFRMFNYKSAENVVSFSVLLFPKWTLKSDGYYYSNNFSYFNVSLLPSLNYISFNSLNTVKNSFSVIYSDVGVESYNRQHPFCVQNASCKISFHKKYEKKNDFRVWSDKALDVVVMTFSNYASFNIFY